MPVKLGEGYIVVPAHTRARPGEGQKKIRQPRKRRRRRKKTGAITYLGP
jgi:hypothetical protein